MNDKEIRHSLRIIEIGKSKELLSSVIKELENLNLIELIFIEEKQAFNGNHILTCEGLELIQD